MKTTNNILSREISENRTFEYGVYIEFKDGTNKSLTNNDLMVNGCEIMQSAEMQSFPLGAAYGKSLNLALSNNDDRWSEFDFYGADIRVFLHYTLSTGDVESIKLGEFYVTEPETYGSTVEVAGIDYMCLTDKAYAPSIQSGTLKDLINDALSQCGLSLSNNHFPNEDFVVNNIPTDKTIRNIISYVAMLAGGFAIIDDTQGLENKVKIIAYNMEVLGDEIIDGGHFHNYGNLPIYDGGDFTFSETDHYSGGTFADQKGYHVFYKAPKVNICTDNVRITGVKNNNAMVGNDGYVLQIENPLIEGNDEAGLNLIYNALIPLEFRPFEMDHVAYPLVDIGDPCLVIDRKQRVYRSIVTDIAYQFMGATTIKCTADSPIRSQSNYTTASTMAVQNQKDIVRNYEEMSEEIRNASGSYTTIVPANAAGEIHNAFIVDVFDPEIMDPSYAWYEPTNKAGEYTVYTHDGTQWVSTTAKDISRITYNHNKRLLMDSNVQWRETATTRSVSTDFGRTWNLAMDASGTVIAQRLNAQTIIGLTIQNAETNPTFKVDPNGNVNGANITGSKFSNKDGTFQAYENGGMKATKGSIGSFTIDSGVLKSMIGSGDNGIWLYPAGGYSSVFGTLKYGGVVIGQAGKGMYCMGYVYEDRPRIARATGGSHDIEVLTHNDIWFSP